MTGLNLFIYPSTMQNESRIFRLSSSIDRHYPFEATMLLGTRQVGLPEVETMRAVGIHRLGLTPKPRGRLGKLLAAFAWQGCVLWNYARCRVDAVNAESVWVLPVCYVLSRLTSAQLFYNPHELETETPTMVGVKRSVAKWIELTFIRKATLVTVVNDSISDWYKSAYSLQSKPMVIRNIPETYEQRVSLRKRLQIDDNEMLYIHTGRLTNGRNIDIILRAFTKAAGAHVVFLGDGPLRDEVRRYEVQSGFIHWLPPVEPASVVPHVREADVALCLIEISSLSYRLSSPNKLFEALAAGTPPLCTNMIEARRLLGASQNGWVIDASEDDLLHHILRIRKSDVADFRDRQPRLATWEAEVAPLLTVYRATLGAQST